MPGSAQRRLGRRYPTSRWQFDNLSYPDKHDVKEELLSDNFDLFKNSLNHECISHLGLSRSAREEIDARASQLGNSRAVQKMLLDLPRNGDYWWEDLERYLRGRSRHEQLYFRLNPWERDDSSGASGVASPPPPPADDSPSTENKPQGTDVEALVGQVHSLLRALTKNAVAGVQPTDESKCAQMVVTARENLHQGSTDPVATGTLLSTTAELLNADGTLVPPVQSIKALSQCLKSIAIEPFCSDQTVCQNNLSPERHAATEEPQFSYIFQPGSGGQNLDCSNFGLLDKARPGNTAVGVDTVRPGNITPEDDSLTENSDQPTKSASPALKPETKPINTTHDETARFDQKLAAEQASAFKLCSKFEVQSDCDKQSHDETRLEVGQSQDGDLNPDGEEAENHQVDGQGCQVDACVSGTFPPSSVASGLPAYAPASRAASSSQPDASHPQPNHGQQGRVESSEHQQSSIPTGTINNNHYHFYEPVKQLNIANTNKIRKQLSVPQPNVTGEEILQSGQGTCEDQEEYCGIPSSAQPHFLTAQGTEDDPQELQSPPGPNSAGTTDESVHYPAWDTNAQETALKQVHTEDEEAGLSDEEITPPTRCAEQAKKFQNACTENSTEISTVACPQPWDRAAHETEPKLLDTGFGLASRDNIKVPFHDTFRRGELGSTAYVSKSFDASSDRGGEEMAHKRPSSFLPRFDILWDDLQEDKQSEKSPQLECSSSALNSTSDLAVTETHTGPEDTAQIEEKLHHDSPNTEDLEAKCDTTRDKDTQEASQQHPMRAEGFWVTLWNTVKEIVSALE